jgi:hypothetical protein
MRAVMVKDDLPDFRGHAALYRLDPPLSLEHDWDEESKGKMTDHVVVSSVDAYSSGPETYIFAANAEGEVTGWLELEGSFRGGKSHGKALRGAGYEVITR